VVRPAEHDQVGDRVVGGVDAAEVLGQAGEALAAHLAAQLGHAAEVGVDGHRRRADLGGQPAQGQRLTSLLGDEARRVLDQRGAHRGVGDLGAHALQLSISISALCIFV
jgi:hypothetical protein